MRDVVIQLSHRVHQIAAGRCDGSAGRVALCRIALDVARGPGAEGSFLLLQDFLAKPADLFARFIERSLKFGARGALDDVGGGGTEQLRRSYPQQ